QRRGGPLRVALIARTDLFEKTREVNSLALFLQLKIATTCALFHAGRQENLQRRVGKHHRAHVAAIGDQARRGPEGALAIQQRGAHRRQRGHFRSPGAGLFGTDGAGHVLAIQQGDLLLTRLAGHEFHVQPARQLDQGGLVGQVDAALAGTVGQQTVDGAGIQKVPAQAVGQQAGQGALARTARPIEGDHGCAHLQPSFATRMPTWADSSRKLGKEVATLAQSWMRIGAPARSEATLKDMAIRWSPWAQISPPPMGPPSMMMPSGVGSAFTPRVCRPSAMTWMRSDSLTRSSSAPRSTVRPSAQAAAMNSTGNSSMASGTRSSGMSMPLSFAERTRISATGSPPTSRSFSRVISPPISLRMSITPVRVGLMPTCSSTSSAPSAMLAATMKKAAEEMSAGTSMRVAVSLWPLCTLAVAPFTSTG